MLLSNLIFSRWKWESTLPDLHRRFHLYIWLLGLHRSRLHQSKPLVASGASSSCFSYLQWLALLPSLIFYVRGFWYRYPFIESCTSISENCSKRWRQTLASHTYARLGHFILSSNHFFLPAKEPPTSFLLSTKHALGIGGDQGKKWTKSAYACQHVTYHKEIRIFGSYKGHIWVVLPLKTTLS